VIPYAWSGSPWWSDDEVDNLHAIVDAVKQRYNVDENRVVVSGVSDGGTGAYYVAMRDTTPYASFLPLNGYWMVLASRDVDDGEIFANNLRNKPLFIVNGGRDPLYPTRIVDPYVEHYQKGGVQLEYHPQPEAGHNTQWWPAVRDSFEAFVRAHPAATAAGHADLGDVGHLQTQSGALARDRSDRISEDRSEIVGRSERDGHGPAPDFGVRSNGTRINRVMPGSNADKIGLKDGDVLVRLNDETVAPARTFRTRSRTSSPARTSICWWRANKPAGGNQRHLRTGAGHRPAAKVVRAVRTLGPCRPGARRQCRRGLDARRHRVHAVTVAGSVRLREAGEGDRQRANRLRWPRAEGRADADPNGPPSTTIGRCSSGQRSESTSRSDLLLSCCLNRPTMAIPHGRVPALTLFTVLVARSMNDTSFDGPFAVTIVVRPGARRRPMAADRLRLKWTTTSSMDRPGRGDRTSRR
jgi:hypothetical protein